MNGQRARKSHGVDLTTVELVLGSWGRRAGLGVMAQSADLHILQSFIPFPRHHHSHPAPQITQEGDRARGWLMQEPCAQARVPETRRRDCQNPGRPSAGASPRMKFGQFFTLLEGPPPAKDSDTR